MAKQAKDFSKYIYDAGAISSEKEAFSVEHHFNLREQAISEQLQFMVKNYKRKETVKRVFQIIIATLLLLLILGFAAVFVGVIVISITRELFNSAILTSLIGTAVSFVSSIIGLLLIVVKYMFPENDDETSMNILKLAIDSDAYYFKNRKGMMADDQGAES